MEALSANWKHGVTRLKDGVCSFRVWAPGADCVDLRILGTADRLVSLERKADGYREAIVADAAPGMRYCFRIDGRDLPDPASRYQPEGVHGPSQVVDSSFPWQDAAWQGLDLDHFVLYELHVGAFTRQGTFDAVIPHVQRLKDLGVTAIELMPVAQFPGSRNWGYDGASPFAVQNSYGGHAGLKRLVNACHQHGLAVVLDVVYNHLGPEGNYLSCFGPYFTEKYKTPWGSALNFDGPENDEVRRFFVENALYWIAECHIDALRLDAVHAIHDESADPFLAELAEAVHSAGAELSRRVHVIAESDLNDTRILRASSAGGMGHDAQWSDDFHHSLHALLTCERTGYYEDFGALDHLAKAYSEGFVYSGQHSAHRRRRHGNSSKEIPGCQFVIFSQNHDQVGNRMLGERLSALVSYEQLKLAAGAVLLSPFLPLLFMGEEYGETAPFLYFVSHTDPGLIEAVRAGRQQEFAAFTWQGTPPDPQDEATFARSTLNHALRDQPRHRELLGFYRELLALRSTLSALATLSKQQMEVTVNAGERVLILRRWQGADEALVFLCFAPSAVHVKPKASPGRWRKLLDSSEQQWLGPGASSPQQWFAGSGVSFQLNPNSVVLYSREAEE